MLQKLEKSSLVIAKKGVLTTLIANLVLARAEKEKRFTVSSWFPRAEDYFSGRKTLPTLLRGEKEPVISEVESGIRHIFNGKVLEGQTPYDSQEKRILEEAPLVFAFLCNKEGLPKNVRDFMKTVGSPELAARILEKFGSISESDPLTVNRFFPEGFSEFQKSAMHRYVFDFIRGVETNVILSASKSQKEAVLRRFGGKWHNYDFSRVPKDILWQAIKKTIEDGSHRIKILNHEQGVKRENLKDWQEFFERIFGWDTFDMWFLRWEKFWDIWVTLGGAWDCICFSRKPIFNPRVLQQW